MVFNLIVKTGAELDINEALDWYERQLTGLSLELLEEIESALLIIQENPELFQRHYREIRVVFTKRFPYGIHYTIEDNTIFIHAVLNTNKKPLY